MERNKEYDHLHNAVHLLAFGHGWFWSGLEPSQVHLATCTKIISLDPLVTRSVEK